MEGLRDRKDAIEKIKSYFGFLFDNGFQVTKAYDRLEFGNWIIVLSSEKCLCRFIQGQR